MPRVRISRRRCCRSATSRRTYAAAGDIPNAIAYQRRADAILEKQLALNVAIGSERQKLLFVNGAAERTDRTISLHLLEARANPDAGALAALVLLQRKGRVLDAMADTFAAVRQRVADRRRPGAARSAEGHDRAAGAPRA